MTPHRIILISFALVAGLLGASCASESAQLTAERLDPIVTIVTDDLLEYVDAGIAPDGAPLSDAKRFRILGTIVHLRNVLHTAMGRPREVQPTLAPSTPARNRGTPEG